MYDQYFGINIMMVYDLSTLMMLILPLIAPLQVQYEEDRLQQVKPFSVFFQQGADPTLGNFVHLKLDVTSEGAQVILVECREQNQAVAACHVV